MKFILFVEGYTELAVPKFLKRWLDTRLNTPVGIQPVRFDGWAQMVKDAPLKARLWLDAPKGDVIAVIALLDLYGLVLPYPASVTTVPERYAWAKTHLEGNVNQPKFHQHFAVHETEAWLLSQPAIFPQDIRAGLTGKAQRPEAVNFDEPPAKLLDRVYQSKTGRHYKKVTHGEELFAKLDTAAAYAKCPHLKVLLDEMQKLAGAAGL